MPDRIPQLVTLLDVSKALCVSPHTVRAWVRRGKLRPIRLCRRLLFHPIEVTRFVADTMSSVKNSVERRDVPRPSFEVSAQRDSLRP